MDDRIVYRGVTFDDVLLEPGYAKFLPSEVDTSSQLTRHIRLNVPISSHPTESPDRSRMVHPQQHDSVDFDQGCGACSARSV